MNKQLVAYGITAPTVIAPPTPFNPLTRLNGVNIQAAGTSGSLVINDCLTLEEASLSNQVCSFPYGQASIVPDVPLQNGLVISEVPAGMTLSVIYSIFVVG